MTEQDSPFLNRLRKEIREADGGGGSQDYRHPARESRQYQALKGEAAAEVDALCERLVREFKTDIAEIDKTITQIAGSLDDQLARGAVSDLFEAAADVLKAQIRRETGRSS